jgi:large subunit ribosomal protein L21
MYAIIRTGGKQARVQSGDVIEIERVKGDVDKLTFAPLLIVHDDGKTVSDRSALDKIKVTAKVLGETKGPKIDIFKYKNKTGYRRRQGHRQTYTQIEITGIKLPAPKKEPAAKKPAEKPAAKKETAAKKPAEKPAAKKEPAAKKTNTVDSEES